ATCIHGVARQLNRRLAGERPRLCKPGRQPLLAQRHKYLVGLAHRTAIDHGDSHMDATAVSLLAAASPPALRRLADGLHIAPGQGRVAVMMERPRGTVGAFWNGSIPQVFLDGRAATAARWGMNRYVLAVGRHHLRVKVTSPSSELAQTSGSSQRQLTIVEQSE